MESLSGKYNYYINSYHTDGKKQASLPALFLLLQESAWNHAEDHNFGWNNLSKINCSWVLSRMRVCINQYPAWQENVTVETWSKEPDALMAYRDFEMFSEDKKIISATSSWLILNIESRRPQRMGMMKDNFPIIPDRHAITDSLKKLPVHNISPVENDIKTIPFSAIDVNGHVNNTMYIQWVLDSLPVEYITTHDVYDIEINYLQESLLGQQYYILVEETGKDEFLCSVIRFPDNKELARMLIKFSK